MYAMHQYWIQVWKDAAETQENRRFHTRSRAEERAFTRRFLDRFRSNGFTCIRTLRRGNADVDRGNEY